MKEKTEQALMEQLIKARYFRLDHPMDNIDQCLGRAKGMADLLGEAVGNEKGIFNNTAVAETCWALSNEIQDALLIMNHFWKTVGHEAWRAYKESIGKPKGAPKRA